MSKQFCANSHDTLVCGRSDNSTCKDCIKTRNKKALTTPAGKAAAKAASKAWNASPAGKVLSRDTGYRYVDIQNADGTQFTTSNVIDAFFLQNGDCKWCQKPLVEDINVDHDHITHKFRGLLHSDCNIRQVGAHTLESAKKLVRYLA